MQYQTCSHIKEDGTYCGSPALQSHKYCHHHLKARGRRLRRARALRDNLPYRLDLPALDDLAAVQVALSEIVQALGSGQLDHRAAGKMLYAIQQTTSVIKFRAKLEAQLETAKLMGGPQLPSVGNCGDQPNAQTRDLARVQAYPGFEQEFGLEPGTDLDAEINSTLQKAEEEAQILHAEAPPPPPPGVRPGSAQYRVYREEVYQSLNIRINRMKHELRDYHEQKRKESEKLAEEFKKEAMSATPPPKPVSKSA
jgi:hypothetical protein